MLAADAQPGESSVVACDGLNGRPGSFEDPSLVDKCVYK